MHCVKQEKLPNLTKMFYNGLVIIATIKEVVLKHHKKVDGTYNIKYRLTQLSESAIIKNRNSYNRSKTRTRRKDSAFISIKLNPEAALILFKHFDRLRIRYAVSNNFNKALSKGLKDIG